MKKAVRIIVIVCLFSLGALAGEKLYLCCGNPCIPGVTCPVVGP